MLALLRTVDGVIGEKIRQKICLEIVVKNGFVEIYEYDRGHKDLILTTPTGCKIDVTP
jgi:hypothetical protein